MKAQHSKFEVRTRISNIFTEKKFRINLVLLHAKIVFFVLNFGVPVPLAYQIPAGKLKHSTRKIIV
jgi:hypothetical protein